MSLSGLLDLLGSFRNHSEPSELLCSTNKFICAETVETHAQVFFPLIFEATDSVMYLGLCFPDIYSLG